MQRRIVAKYQNKVSCLPDGLCVEKKKHTIVWVCWFQGVDNAPSIVKKCIGSFEKLEDKEVRIITSENYSDYTSFPEHIIDKWERGIITPTHFSDLLRAELLCRHGGIWLDATVYTSATTLPEYIDNSWLFFYQTLKPGLDGKSILLSSWAMSSVKSNPLLEAARESLFKYWLDNDTLEDYFLFHVIVSAVLYNNPKYWNSISPVCNSHPHLLQLNFYNQYNAHLFEHINRMTTIHKLTYKIQENKNSASSMLTYFINKF
jgi:hypothetical protein